MKIATFLTYRLPILWLGLALACSPKEEAERPAPTWPHAVAYEIFVQSFYDSDGDGIGDIRGMTSKLDYLEDLGVEGVWLMPIMPSPSYHKYDVTDYRDIHPDYGTLEDFKAFVREAHARNIRVIIDLVVNHCGAGHPWFQSALEGPESLFRDYFVWANDAAIDSLNYAAKAAEDSDNVRKWIAVEGQEEKYYAYFGGHMPDLNFDNPKVRQEVYDIGRFWLQEIGVDGFRLDAAKHIFPDERAEDSHAFWVEFRQEMERAKPDVYLVGEVWSDAQTVAPYLKGLPALFNFDLGYAITHVVNAGMDTIRLITKYKEINDFYHTVTSDFIDATFVKNHDQNRILSEVGGDKNKARMATALLLTLPGSPYLYYGEEIGMLGQKPDEYIREPFLWEEKAQDTGRPTWIDPRYSTDATVRPLSMQLADPSSIHQFYKRMIGLRRGSKALTFGNIEPFDAGNSSVVAFFRAYEGERVLVIHNVSAREQKLEVQWTTLQFQSSDEVELAEGILALPAFSTVILRE
jgi:alpha-amylase